MRRIPLHYPLEWPASKPRTSQADKRVGNYSKGGDRNRRDITMAEAQTRVFDAIDKFTMRGHNYVINPDDCRLKTMFELRQDGMMRRGQRTPPDVGAVCTFTMTDTGAELLLAIDKYTKIEQNIAAIAACIDSLRQLWRADAGTFLAAASGLNALPAPSVIAIPNWRSVLGFQQYAEPTLDEVKRAYRVASKVAHPDNGGNDNTQAALNAAYAAAKEELRGLPNAN